MGSIPYKTYPEHAGKVNPESVGFVTSTDMNNTNSSPEINTTPPSTTLRITPTGLYIPPSRPTTVLDDGTMPSSATEAVGHATKNHTTKAKATETSTAISPEVTLKRLKFVKAVIKSDEWEVVDTIRVDNETHCFLAKTATGDDNIDWKSGYTLKVQMKTGGEWHRFFFAGMTAAAAASMVKETTGRKGTTKVSILFRFGCDMDFEFTFCPPFRFGFDMNFEFTFSVPERTVANQPHVSQKPSRAETKQDKEIEEAIRTLQISDSQAAPAKGADNKETSRAKAKQPANTTNSLTEDFEIIQMPWDKRPLIDRDAWRAYWRRELFKRRFGTIEGSKMYQQFSKQPVSKHPKNQRSLLTEQLRAQEQEEEDEEADIAMEEVADDQARWYNLMMARALARTTTGSYAVSRTLAPSPRDPLTGTRSEIGGKDSELVYLPYDVLGRIHKMVDSACASRWDKRDAHIALDGLVVQTICCNCAGVMESGIFHCSACGLHKLCKDCSVGIPVWSVSQMEKAGFNMKTDEGRCEG